MGFDRSRFSVVLDLCSRVSTPTAVISILARRPRFFFVYRAITFLFPRLTPYFVSSSSAFSRHDSFCPFRSTPLPIHTLHTSFQSLPRTHPINASSQLRTSPFLRTANSLEISDLPRSSANLSRYIASFPPANLVFFSPLERNYPIYSTTTRYPFSGATLTNHL